jgi:hypothetical protein
MWLRRHEERSEARSVDRFSDAMRVLSGRPPDVRDPVRPTKTLSRPSKGRAPARRSVRRNKQTRSLALRRRRILGALLLICVVTSLLVPFTPLTWAPGLLPAAATVVYLVHLRLQARRSRELSRTRQSIRRRTLARLRRFDVADQIFSARRAQREEGTAAEGKKVATRAQEAEREVADGWQPVPVPLPTYVTKPVAPRPARPAADHPPHEEPFDQTASASAAPAVTSALRQVEPPDELDAMMQRRAVND